MSRLTVKALQEEIDELRQEIQEIKEMLTSINVVQYVKEVRPPEPVSEALDFVKMSNDLSNIYATYSEGSDFWGNNKYL